MKLIDVYILEIKKSKFYTYGYIVDNKDEIDEIFFELKNKHKKATHMPYAYKIDNLVKKSDDKEPSNTAGTPIYNLIIKNELNNILIVTVRYFGGTKLGSGLLKRSYIKGANEIIKKVDINN